MKFARYKDTTVEIVEDIGNEKVLVAHPLGAKVINKNDLKKMEIKENGKSNKTTS